VLLLGRMPQGQVLLPGNRRKTKAINVLLPGAEAEGMLPLGDVVRGVRHRGNAATGGTLQGESYRVTIGGTL